VFGCAVIDGMVENDVRSKTDIDVFPLFFWNSGKTLKFLAFLN